MVSNSNRMKKENSRIDDSGRAYAGSQLQIQIYVNRRTDELSQNVFDALSSIASLNPKLGWVSPLKNEKFVEYQDRAFLKAVGFEHLADDLKEFWPRGGPSWDALAVLEFPEGLDSKGVLLVEAKSHPPEIYGSGLQAKSSKSKTKIEMALNNTKKWLRIEEGVSWTGPLYQSANRLAHLYFFREVVKVPTWLVNIYFLNDPHSSTNSDEWQNALERVKEELGLKDIIVPYMVQLFLEARDRCELFQQPEEDMGHKVKRLGVRVPALDM